MPGTDQLNTIAFRRGSMIPKKIFEQIEQNISSIAKQDSALGKELWQELLKAHPADLAQVLQNVSREHFQELYTMLPDELKVSTFDHFSDSLAAYSLSILDEKQKAMLLENIDVDAITDLFDHLSDQDIKIYFELLQKKRREQVISLLRFSSDSAGGKMDVDVVSLVYSYTVERAIQILQKLQPEKDLHQKIYVTDDGHKLVGYIQLEDLVLRNPKDKISSFMQENELIIQVDEDQEEVAKQMVHYQELTAPVVNDSDIFLGIIAGDTLVNVIEEEAREDVYKISATPAIKQTYFETSFIRLLTERSFILVVLLLFESASGSIQKHFDDFLMFPLTLFIAMLISTGGNTSSQTSALAIQGLASGEINYSNIKRFVRREILMAFMMALILGLTSFARVYITEGDLVAGSIVSISLALIVMVSVILGSSIPLVLKHLGIDPAFSAGPFLATVMDILGITIFCYISKIVYTTLI